MIRKFAVTSLVIILLTGGAVYASTWEADLAHSSVSFKVRHLMISNVPGSFDKFTASVILDDKDLAKSTVNVAIEAASINTDNAKRDTHLRSVDFFDVTNYPQITFISKRLEKNGDAMNLIGDLTIRGITKEVALRVNGPTPTITDPMGHIRWGASATARINRADFGLTWNKPVEAGGVLVSDEVDIAIEMEMELVKE
jgi:polyisoprenoid-binding protein YceI